MVFALYCLRFGYYAAVISSVSFLGLGTLAYMFDMSGGAISRNTAEGSGGGG